jgi:hypothetical protein
MQYAGSMLLLPPTIGGELAEKLYHHGSPIVLIPMSWECLKSECARRMGKLKKLSGSQRAHASTGLFGYAYIMHFDSPK